MFICLLICHLLLSEGYPSKTIPTTVFLYTYSVVVLIKIFHTSLILINVTMMETFRGISYMLTENVRALLDHLLIDLLNIH